MYLGLSIVFWQMKNGIEYLPFKCHNNNGINHGVITFGMFTKWHNTKLLILCNWFEQTLEYNHHEILKHQFILLNQNDPLLYMFVIHIIKLNIQQDRWQTYQSCTNKNNDKTSGIFPWLLRIQDSSQAQISPNAPKVYGDDNKMCGSWCVHLETRICTIRPYKVFTRILSICQTFWQMSSDMRFLWTHEK